MYESIRFYQQIHTPSFVATPAVTGYIGPGNIVSGATAWWGLRAYSAAQAGTVAIRLRRDSDNVESDFNTLSDGTGSLDVASIATFKGAANLFITKLYDQTGNVNDLAQATAANQPGLTLSGLGSLPIITFSGAPQFLSNSTMTPLANMILSLSIVANSTNTASQQTILGFAGIGPRTGYNNSGANTMFWYNGAVLTKASVTDGSWHAINEVGNDPSSVIAVDGASSTGSIASGGLGTNPFDFGGQDASGAEAFTGSATEAGAWLSTSFTAGQITSMNANQHAYWGF